MLDKGEQDIFEVKYQEDTKHNLAPFFAVVNVHSPEMAINALGKLGNDSAGAQCM